MKTKNILLVALLVLLVGMVSCKKDHDIPTGKVFNGGSGGGGSNNYIGSGVFVLNEGTYQSYNASLSFYDPLADTVANNLFYKVNNASLGDVAISLNMATDGKLYIVINNSNCIYRIDANTMVCDFKITDFYSPREIYFVAPNKAYVSDLKGTALWIINTQDMAHTGSIEMGKTTEKMVQVGSELYVSNWSKIYVPDIENNTVQVVDINNDVKIAEIAVGKEPNSMVVDKNNHVWVLCEGATWEEDGENPSLWEINPLLKTALKRYEFEGTTMVLRANPSRDQLYLIYDNEVRRFDIATLTLSDTFRIVTEPQGMFYNMAIEPETGDIYVTDAKNYMMNGSVYRYSDLGVLVSSFEVGVVPGSMLFKF